MEDNKPHFASLAQFYNEAVLMMLGSSLRAVEDYGRTTLGKGFLRESLTVEEYVHLMGACASFTDKLKKPKTKGVRKHLPDGDLLDEQQNDLVEVLMSIFMAGAYIQQKKPSEIQAFQREMEQVCTKYLE